MSKNDQAVVERENLQVIEFNYLEFLCQMLDIEALWMIDNIILQ